MTITVNLTEEEFDRFRDFQHRLDEACAQLERATSTLEWMFEPVQSEGLFKTRYEHVMKRTCATRIKLCGIKKELEKL